MGVRANRAVNCRRWRAAVRPLARHQCRTVACLPSAQLSLSLLLPARTRPRHPKHISCRPRVWLCLSLFRAPSGPSVRQSTAKLGENRRPPSIFQAKDRVELLRGGSARVRLETLSGCAPLTAAVAVALRVRLSAIPKPAMVGPSLPETRAGFGAPSSGRACTWAERQTRRVGRASFRRKGLRRGVRGA